MSKRTLLLLIAAVIAGFTALSVKSRLSEAPVSEQSAQATRVLIAKHDLSPGSFVQAASDLDWGPPPAPVVLPPEPPKDENAPQSADIPKPAAPPIAVAQESYLYENSVKLADYNGAVVRKQLHAGDPVTASALVKAGSGGLLSAVLNPGMRAISISVNATSGNAGFVLPGDYVDLIVTREVDVNAQGRQVSGTVKTVFSKTFIENVRVLAADQALDNPDNKAMLAKTITVEVTPAQAQAVAVAEEMGKISVSLRSTLKEGLATDDNNNNVPQNLPSISDHDLGLLPRAPAAVQPQHQEVKLLRPKDSQSLQFDSQDNGIDTNPLATPTNMKAPQ